MVSSHINRSYIISYIVSDFKQYRIYEEYHANRQTSEDNKNHKGSKE